MAVKKKSEKRIKKEKYWSRLQDVAHQYKNVLFVNADNVSSLQISKLRVHLRDKGAYMIMGKNTLMKAALTASNTAPEEGDSDYEERKDSFEFSPNIEKIIGQLRGNINLIFTNGDLGEVKEVLDKEVRESPAKPGMLAPKDVTVPKGPTGLDPRQTGFFQTLQVQTKIQRGQIEIVAEKQVVFKDTRVDSTQAALLDKLKIYPFEYKMKVEKVLQDGGLFPATVLDISLDDVRAKFRDAAAVQAKLSLGAGYSTSLSAPHTLLAGFKNLVAVCASSGYSFPQAQAMLDAAKNAPAAGAPAAAATAEVKEEEAPADDGKKEEEEAVDGMAGLFGDDDDGY